MAAIRIKKGTRAQIDAAATVNGLNAGEPYLVTDEGVLALGLTASTYAVFVPEAPVDNNIYARKNATWVDITDRVFTS